MTGYPNAFEALSLVPGWDPATFEIEELKGGLTNRTYRLRRGTEEYVLRLDAEEAGFFQFDRTNELSILADASEAGLAPPVVYADKSHGILVTTYLQGRAWGESDLKLNRNLEALAELLRRVHALPLCGQRLEVPSVARNYARYLSQRHGLHSFATHCVEVIDDVPIHVGAVCCHNDIVAANIIESERIRLIDWEFACDNDPMFDLASAIGFHNLDAQSAGVLLDAYAGGAGSEATERLAQQVRVYDAIQWLWLASRHLVFPSKVQARRLEELQQRIR